MDCRRHKRTQVQVGCWIKAKDSTSCCSSFDLSDSGISICTETPLPVGQTATLQFYTPQSASALTVTAEVIWSRLEPNGAMGLRFVDISPEQLETLRTLALLVKHRERHLHGDHGRR
jgi:c-di-GMP-binding flagellar brake protein YcgR